MMLWLLSTAAAKVLSALLDKLRSASAQGRRGGAGSKCIAMHLSPP
jgi:hypothetical protein